VFDTLVGRQLPAYERGRTGSEDGHVIVIGTTTTAHLIVSAGLTGGEEDHCRRNAELTPNARIHARQPDTRTYLPFFSMINMAISSPVGLVVAAAAAVNIVSFRPTTTLLFAMALTIKYARKGSRDP
jgi:hypothetical protein